MDTGSTGTIGTSAPAHAKAAMKAGRQLARSCALSILLLALSLGVSYLAAVYANERAGNSVTDIILSNIPVFDVDWVFVYGPLIMWGVVAAILIRRPAKIPFALKSISLFVLIRSAFVILTHFGPFPTHAYLDPTSFIFMFTSGADLFFSAHTGLPFLLALMFWDEPMLRTPFLAASVFFGAVVLMGHFHYSIDVMAAFFITHTIYHIAKRIFRNDLELFSSVRVLK